MSYSSVDAKEAVRQAIDIVDLVGTYIQLRRQGRNYVGLCPWHDDSRPSMQVNPERQSFKCWVCDIGGDIFSFVQKMEGISFPEALAMLAERAGVELKPARPESPGAPEAMNKKTLLQAAAWAEKQYHECLLTAPEAEPARKYLAERGLTAESIAKFRLGFAPLTRDWLLRRIDHHPQRTRVLELIGIIARSDAGDYYDRFRGRVLFSIRDAQARPVGLGGRLLPELGLSSPAKYVNSPETQLFTKSKLLYALDLARDAIRRTGDALVMEGYTDVIVAHQYGFENAVAVLGTALGAEHIRILKHYAKRVVLVLDGDEAGQRRTKEVLGLFLSQNADLRVLTLPDGLDPCDYLQSHGADAFKRLLETRAVDALEHAFHAETRGLDVERDVHGATESLERLVAMIAQAPRLRGDTEMDGRLREEKALQRAAAFFRVGEDEVRRRLTGLRRQSSGRASQRSETNEKKPVAASEPLDPWRRELFELLVAHAELWPVVRSQLNEDWLTAGASHAIYETCCRLLDEGLTPDFDRLMLELDDPAAKSLLVALDENWREKGERVDPPDVLVAQLIERFNYEEARKRRPAQSVALREGQLDSDQGLAVLLSILEQEGNRQGIAKPMEG